MAMAHAMAHVSARMQQRAEGREYFRRWAVMDDEADSALMSAFKSEWKRKNALQAKIFGLNKKLLTGGRHRKPRGLFVDYHARIVADYFGAPATDVNGVITKGIQARFSVTKFQRRFRMSDIRFCDLLHEIQDPERGDDFFRTGEDAVGKHGPTPLQKLVAAVRQLAYGTASDHVEEYTGVAEGTARKALRCFCNWLDKRYGAEYLGAWTEEAIKKEMAANEERGFPGMLGSIDCTHWSWKNCPVAWQGQYQDRGGTKSIVAEAIAGHDMYFWHAFLGAPGSLNDLNVLGRSTLHEHYLKSPAASVKYTILDTDFTGAYFLADGIYPNYAFLMKSVSVPRTAKEKLFSKYQEGCRKDVERAFGRMLSKWHILGSAARSWYLVYMKRVWRACFILHNMTIRDSQGLGKGDGYESESDLGVAERESDRRLNVEDEDASSDDEDYEDGVDFDVRDEESEWNDVMDRLDHMHCQDTHHLLKRKVQEKLWVDEGDDDVE